MTKNYVVSIEHKENTMFRKEFMTIRQAEKWACKMVRTILVCDCPATIVNNNTGEIMIIISR